MFTKKEKLLIRPWIVQRYNQHRDKVEKAKPAIDYLPPADHNHVTLKLKKAQKELERQQRIEYENIRLLQRLGSIMSRKRIDNFWTTPRPNFLSREPLYDYARRPSRSKSSTSFPSLSEEALRRRKSRSAVRCSACSHQVALKFEKSGFEERVPFAPPRQTKNQKLIETPSNVHVCCVYCC